MKSIGETLIKLFGADDVYLGKVDPSESQKPKEKTKSNIFKSLGGALLGATKTILEVGLPTPKPFKNFEKEKKKLGVSNEEVNQLHSRVESSNSWVSSRIGKHNEFINKRKYPTSPLHKDVKEFVEQKWVDSVDRPEIEVGREYLQNIMKALVMHKAKPEQITETLFRDTFKKKNFSDNQITTLWGEYNQWLRQYRTKGSLRFGTR